MIETTCDVLVIGAGTAGLPAAIFAARGGASVIVIDAADVVGGTLHLSAGQISAALPSTGRRHEIVDHPDHHFADIVRISRNTADPLLTRLAVDHLPATLTWLVGSGLALPDDHPVIDPVNEPYSIPRTYWHRDGGRAILRAILPQFERECARGRIVLHLGMRLKQLCTEEGCVVGALAETCDSVLAFRARSTILTTGGFTADRAMFARMTGSRAHYGRGYSHALGEGLAAALAVGGVVANRALFLPAFAAVENPLARDGFAFETRTDPAVRAPWEVYVNLDGRRFMREDQPDLNLRQRALLQQRHLRFWAIYDAGVERTAPPFLSGGWRALDERFDAEVPGYIQANDLDGLAAGMGVDRTTLARTLATYNDALARRAADPFGRVHRPCAIGEPPFRAIRHSGWSAVGFAGLAVDGELRVTDGAGRPIPGLYAAGEIIGMAATSGQSFCSGMSLGPALAFGRLLGQRLVAESA